MLREDKAGLRAILLALAGSNTAAYVTGRMADKYMSDSIFTQYATIGIAGLVMAGFYYGIYKLLERIIDRQPEGGAQTIPTLIKDSDPPDSNYMDYANLGPSIGGDGIWIVQYLGTFPHAIGRDNYFEAFKDFVKPKKKLEQILQSYERHGLIEESAKWIRLTPKARGYCDWLKKEVG